jgi:hypothetical protein
VIDAWGGCRGSEPFRMRLGFGSSHLFDFSSEGTAEGTKQSITRATMAAHAQALASTPLSSGVRNTVSHRRGRASPVRCAAAPGDAPQAARVWHCPPPDKARTVGPQFYPLDAVSAALHLCAAPPPPQLGA